MKRENSQFAQQFQRSCDAKAQKEEVEECSREVEAKRKGAPLLLSASSSMQQQPHEPSALTSFRHVPSRMGSRRRPRRHPRARTQRQTRTRSHFAPLAAILKGESLESKVDGHSDGRMTSVRRGRMETVQKQRKTMKGSSLLTQKVCAAHMLCCPRNGSNPPRLFLAFCRRIQHESGGVQEKRTSTRMKTRSTRTRIGSSSGS